MIKSIIGAVLGNVKSYAMIYAVVAALAVAGYGAWFMYNVGYESCETDIQEAVDEETKRQGEAADELKQLEDEKSGEVTEKIIYIRSQIKPGECLGIDAPAHVLDDLGGVYDPGSEKRR